MPGPPPKPVERKRRLGNPGQKPLPAKIHVLPTLQQLEPPETLGADGLAFWQAAMRTCGYWLADSDQALLRMTAEAFDRRAFLLSVLASEGWHVVTDKGYPYKHPLVAPLADLEAQIGKWLGQLGMTPTDRTRMGVAEVQAVSKLEAIQARAAKR